MIVKSHERHLPIRAITGPQYRAGSISGMRVSNANLKTAHSAPTASCLLSVYLNKQLPIDQALIKLAGEIDISFFCNMAIISIVTS